MGLLDIAGKVLMTYKADVSQAKAEVRSLSAEQKKAAEQAIKAQEAHNKTLDGYKASLEQAAVALGTVGVGVAVLKKGYDEYMQTIRLQSAAGKTSIDELQEAAGGLRTKMELLQFAARANTGDFKLNQQQMDDSVKAMRVLTSQGRDSEEVYNDLTKAISENSTDALKKYGIQIEGASTATEKHNAILKEMTRIAAQGPFSTVGDDAARAGVKFKDSMHELEVGLGKVAVALTPVVEQLAEMAENIAGVTSALSDLATDIPGGSYIGKGLRGFARYGPQNGVWGLVNAGRDVGGRLLSQDNPVAGFDAAGQQAADDAAVQDGARKLAVAVSVEVAKSAALAIPYTLSNQLNRMDAIVRGAYARRRRRGGGGGGGGDAIGYENNFGVNEGEYSYVDPTSVGVDLGSALGLTKGAGGSLNNALWSRGQIAGYDAANARISGSKLAEMFGPISEFNAYAAAFGTLQSAVTSAFDAWITGSESISTAIKHAIAEGLRGTASQMLSQALLHGAYAIGSLAFGDVKGAATHGKAAGLFAAGAIAVGGLAGALGAGQSGGATSSGLGGSAPALGGNPGLGGGSKNVTIVYGDDFADDSYRRRQRRVDRMISTANTAGNGAVVFQ